MYYLYFLIRVQLMEDMKISSSLFNIDVNPVRDLVKRINYEDGRYVTMTFKLS